MDSGSQDIALTVNNPVPFRGKIACHIEFPKNVIPQLGSSLYGEDGTKFEIYAVGWPKRPDDWVWGCMLSGELENIRDGCKLYLKISN